MRINYLEVAVVSLVVAVIVTMSYMKRHSDKPSNFICVAGGNLEKSKCSCETKRVPETYYEYADCKVRINGKDRQFFIYPSEGV